MRSGLNLRSDLRRLSDAEIGEPLERTIDEREEVYRSLGKISTIGNKWLYQQGFGMPSGGGGLFDG